MAQQQLTHLSGDAFNTMASYLWVNDLISLRSTCSTIKQRCDNAVGALQTRIIQTLQATAKEVKDHQDDVGGECGASLKLGWDDELESEEPDAFIQSATNDLLLSFRSCCIDWLAEQLISKNVDEKNQATEMLLESFDENERVGHAQMIDGDDRDDDDMWRVAVQHNVPISCSLAGKLFMQSNPMSRVVWSESEFDWENEFEVSGNRIYNPDDPRGKHYYDPEDPWIFPPENAEYPMKATILAHDDRQLHPAIPRLQHLVQILIWKCNAESLKYSLSHTYVGAHISEGIWDKKEKFCHTLTFRTKGNQKIQFTGWESAWC